MINKSDEMKRQIDLGEYPKYYGASAWCANCGSKMHRYIRKGVGLDGLGDECENCGCFVGFGVKWLAR